MKTSGLDIRRLRLRRQHIEGPIFEKPEDVVRWMGAVQAQDYRQAAWALGLRTAHASADEVDRALAEASILRTHVMRPTWHFVSPEDLRWMLLLTAPRIKAGSTHRYRELELDDEVLERANVTLARALEGGRYLTRDELGRVLEGAGIETGTPQRLVYILMSAELDGVICSGPKRGRQFTYALLDERVPQGPVIGREEAVVKLVRRYFTSHGPATVRDFVWWSGLTTADARAGLEALNGQILSENNVDGVTYWRSHGTSSPPEPSPSAHLLPAFDEYTVAYADRLGLLLPGHSPQTPTFMLSPVIVVDGYVVGTWRRTFKSGAVVIEASPLTPLSEVERRGVAASAARYGEFLGMPATLA